MSEPHPEHTEIVDVRTAGETKIVEAIGSSRWTRTPSSSALAVRLRAESLSAWNVSNTPGPRGGRVRSIAMGLVLPMTKGPGLGKKG